MPAYYKVEATLNSQAVQVGIPSPQTVRVTIPLVGPVGPAGPQGEQGPPGEVSGSLAWDNVTEKPTTFPPEAHTHTADQIVDFTAAVEAVSPPADWDTLANKPSTFPPSAHGHVAADVSDFSTAAAAAAPVQSVAGRTGTVTLAKADVGLSNVDNTTDLAKPISTATQSALDGKAATSHTHTASQVTDFTTAAAAAAPVQSVNGNTGTVTVAVPSASTATPQALGTAAAGTSADFARADHVHQLPTAADIGAVADTDARLSDSRTPTSHASSHAATGSDPVFDQDLDTTSEVQFQRVQAAELVGAAFIADGSLVDPPTSDSVAVTALGFEFTGDAASYTRTNLDLGTAATADIGTTAGTVAAGDDSRFSDIPDPSSATPQALGSASAGTSDDYSRGDHIHAAPALNDLSNVSAAAPSDNDVLVFDTATSTWVAEAPAGGGSGEVRSDFVSPYTYTGLAPAGTSESTASWTIRRSEFDAGGSFVATLTASAVEWNDRLTVSYA
jgi:hypothetical protein